MTASYLSRQAGDQGMVDQAGSVPSAFEIEAVGWWELESSDWDLAVEGGATACGAAGSIWSGMPVVDSKAVARLAPIFEKHFGKPLDTKLIRPGGYSSISEAARDLEAKFKAARLNEKENVDGRGKRQRSAWREAS